MNLAKNIKVLRLNAGYTLEEMAEKLGLSGKTSYYAYEIKKAEPPVEKIIVMAKLFKISIDDMILGVVRQIQHSESEIKEIKINKLKRKINKLKNEAVS